MEADLMLVEVIGVEPCGMEWKGREEKRKEMEGIV